MNSVFAAKKLLVVPSKQLKPADYITFTVLLDVLRKSAEKVDLCLPESFDSKLTAAVKLPEVNIIKSVQPRRFVLSFNRGEDHVKNVQWHQTDEKINVYISMEQGMFNADGMKARAEGAEYDAILYFGINDFAQVESAFKAFPAIVHEVKNISFGGTFAIPHAKVELVRAENGETNAELVYAACQGKGATPEHYSRLMGSILLATRRFAHPNVKARTFRACAELMANGANLGRANALADQFKSSGTPQSDKPSGGSQKSSAGSQQSIQQKPADQPQQAKALNSSNNGQGSQNKNT